MRVLVAIVVSLAVHAAVVLAVALYLDYAPLPEVTASLDLSSVELSFAEKAEDAQAVPARETAEVGRPHEMPDAPARQESPPRVRPTSAAPPPELPADIAADDPQLPIEKLVEPPPQPPPPARPAPAVAPRQARIDAPPRPQRSIRPDYPRGARQRGEQGDVRLEISVSASGAVEHVRVIGSSGFSELDAAAVRAASAAKFAPAKSDGKSVASKAQLTLAFKLK